MLLWYLISSSVSDSWRACRKTCGLARFDLFSRVFEEFGRFLKVFLLQTFDQLIRSSPSLEKKSFNELLRCGAAVTINVHHFLFCIDTHGKETVGFVFHRENSN